MFRFDLFFVWFVIFVIVKWGVLFDRTGFGLVCFGLVCYICGCNIGVSILIDYNGFDEDKAGYWFRDWLAMSSNMTLLSGI